LIVEFAMCRRGLTWKHKVVTAFPCHFQAKTYPCLFIYIRYAYLRHFLVYLFTYVTPSLCPN